MLPRNYFLYAPVQPRSFDRGIVTLLRYLRQCHTGRFPTMRCCMQLWMMLRDFSARQQVAGFDLIKIKNLQHCCLNFYEVDQPSPWYVCGRISTQQLAVYKYGLSSYFSLSRVNMDKLKWVAIFFYLLSCLSPISFLPAWFFSSLLVLCERAVSWVPILQILQTSHFPKRPREENMIKPYYQSLSC